MATRNITLIVRAVGAREAARQIQATGNAIERTAYNASRASKSLKSMGEQMRGIGSVMTRNITLPIVGVGAAAIKMNRDFNRSMLRIQTQAGVSAKQVAAFRKEFMAMGRTGTKSPKELADAMFHIASVMTGRTPPAGKTPADMAMDILKASQQLSTIGGSNLEQTASALSAAYVTGIKGTQDLNTLAGTLNATVGQGNMTMQDLVTVMGTGILPVAKNAGLGLTDVAGAIALLTDEGMKASQAGNLMRTSFHFLTSPSDRGRKAMESIGVTPGMLAEKLQGPDGLLNALRTLNTATMGLSTADRNDVLGRIFPTGRGTPMYVLLNQLDSYQNKLNAIKRLGTAKQLNDAYKKTMASDPVKIDKAWASIKTSLTALGGDLLPTVADGFGFIADKVASAVDAFHGLNKNQQKWILISAGVLAAIGPVLAVLGTVGIMIGGVMQLSSWAGGAVGGMLRKIGIGKGRGGGRGGGLGGILGGGGMSAAVMNVDANIVNVRGVGAGAPGGGKAGGVKNTIKRAAKYLAPTAATSLGATAVGAAATSALVLGPLGIAAWMAHDKKNVAPPTKTTKGIWIDSQGFPVKGPGKGHRFLPAGSTIDDRGYNALHRPAQTNLGLTGHLASGGPVHRAGMYEVGERGSEVVHLPEGAYVTPHGGTVEYVSTPIVLQMDSVTVAKTTARGVLRRQATR